MQVHSPLTLLLTLLFLVPGHLFAEEGSSSALENQARVSRTKHPLPLSGDDLENPGDDLHTKQLIKLGSSSSLSGPNKGLGLAVHRGLLAALAQANRSSDRFHYDLIVLDDGYAPHRCIENTQRLLAEEVHALVGYVGTPTSLVAVPLAEAHQTLFFGAVTGAELLRDEALHQVVNLRASYQQEIDKSVEFLVDQESVSPERIAFLTQRDGFGTAIFEAGQRCLIAHGLRDAFHIPHGEYERGTTSVESAIASILGDAPNCQAIILGATSPAARRAILLARQHGFDGWFICLSFTNAEFLIDQLGAAAEPILLSSVVPPIRLNGPLVREFRDAMQRSFPHDVPTGASFEGYIIGRTLARAIESSLDIPTRESVLGLLHAHPFWNRKTCTIEAFRPFHPDDTSAVWLVPYGSSVPASSLRVRERQP